GPQHARAARVGRAPDRLARDARGVEPCHLEVVAREVARPGAVGRARGHPEADERLALVVEVAMRGGARACGETGLVKARADDPPLLRLRNRLADLPRPG